MKQKSKKTISEAAAEAMGLSGYPMSNGKSDFDASGRGSQISQSIDFGGAAMAQAQVPVGAGMAAPTAMASSSEDEEDTDEDTEEEIVTLNLLEEKSYLQKEFLEIQII